ncbi:unnamed protein product, partial [Rangifer tarandus platyrhynchus]
GEEKRMPLKQAAEREAGSNQPPSPGLCLLLSVSAVNRVGAPCLERGPRHRAPPSPPGRREQT